MEFCEAHKPQVHENTPWGIDRSKTKDDGIWPLQSLTVTVEPEVPHVRGVSLVTLCRELEYICIPSGTKKGQVSSRVYVRKYIIFVVILRNGSFRFWDGGIN